MLIIFFFSPVRPPEGYVDKNIVSTPASLLVSGQSNDESNGGGYSMPGSMQSDLSKQEAVEALGGEEQRDAIPEERRGQPRALPRWPSRGGSSAVGSAPAGGGCA